MKPFSIVITGAASGLGRSLARGFAKQADLLILSDLDAQGLASVEQELADQCPIRCVLGDITQSACQSAIADEVEALDAGLGLLINNAGITHRSPVIDTQVKVFSKVMTVDWQAPVELTHKLLPALIRARGGIINIGSMAGWMPVPGRAAYCAAKAALSQYFEVLRLELEPKGIHVLNVYPSFLATGIEAHALGADGRAAGHARSTVGRIRDADWMALRITSAWERKAPWIHGDALSQLGSLLWRLWPSQYLRSVRKRFASEL